MLNRKEAVNTALKNRKYVLEQKVRDRENKIALLKETDSHFKETEDTVRMLGANVALTAISGDLVSLQELQKELTDLTKEKEKILNAADIKPVEYVCDKCKDTGFCDGKLCECITSDATNLMLEDLKRELPLESNRFECFNLEYYPAEQNGASPKKRMTEIFKFAKEYAINFNPKTSPNLLFMGSAGLGKTHLSLSIVYDLINSGYDCIYSSAYNLFAAMENDQFANRSNDTYNNAVNCDLLVIDDLGSEFLTSYVQSCIYNVINTRLLSGKPTLISTNLSMKEISEKYTARIASRLIGSYISKKFIGNDIRQIKNT
ncbi:MAG: ATP-binding protein [Clostridia bacterium]|nr:ATP-binding protein [Clostridia bacterium]